MRILMMVCALLLGLATTPPPALAAQPTSPDTIKLPGGSSWDFADLVFTPDGTRMITTLSDHSNEIERILVLDAATGKVISDRRVADTHGRLVMSPRGDRVLLTGRGYVMDAKSGELIAKLPVEATAATFSPDGSRFFLTGADKSIVAYDTATVSPVVTGTPHPERFPGLAISPSGDRLVSTSDALRSFDPTTLAPIAQGSPMFVSCPTFSPSGDRVFAMTRDEFQRNAFSVFDASSLVLLSTVPLALDLDSRQPPCPLVAPDGSRAYVSYAGGGGFDVAVIDTSTMSMVGSSLKSYAEEFKALTPDGKTLWGGGYGNRLVSAPVARMAPTPPALPWVGRYDSWKALPEVVDVDSRMSRILEGSFFTKGWKRSYQSEEEDDPPWQDVIHTPESTRVRSYQQVAYWSATEVCSRPITKRSPATIAQDRRATFTCRPRSSDPSELDPVQELQSHTPIRHLEDNSPKAVIESDFSATGSSSSDLRATEYAPDGYFVDWWKEQDYIHIEITPKGRRQAYMAWGAFDFYYVQFFTSKVPRLPSVASLRRARAT